MQAVKYLLAEGVLDRPKLRDRLVLPIAPSPNDRRARIAPITCLSKAALLYLRFTVRRSAPTQRVIGGRNLIARAEQSVKLTRDYH